VIYREQRARQRAENEEQSGEVAKAPGSSIQITMADGSRVPLDLDRIHTIVREACAGLADVTESEIIDEALRNLYDGVSMAELSDALVITARTLIEKEPNYSFAAARLLLDNLRAEALNFLGVANNATQQQMSELYPQALPIYINKGIEL
jgi:ribonucleoside-diphosphate reductase alpha chain